MEMIVSSEWETRANLFREMTTLAKSHATPRYSKNLDYAAVVILFRSCSTDEFVRTFLPLPSPRAVYAHFRSVLGASRDRLHSLDAMIAYLSVQIAYSSELIEGSVLAIDAICCSNTFLGTIAHTDIVQEADRALELDEHAHHHVNLAGVHIDENPPHAKTFHIEMPTNLDPETIAGISV
jgi:hypothetical protein